MEKVSIELNDSEAVLEGRKSGFLESAIYTLLIVIPFILPLFFIPSPSFSVQFSKMIVLSLAVIVSVVCWTIARLKDGRFVLPNRLLITSGLAVVGATLISGIFSATPRVAIFGQSLEMGTVSAIVVFFVLMFLAPTVFRSKDRIFYAYLSFFSVFFLLSLFHGSRIIFGSNFLAMGIFTDITANTVGRWNDLAVFFGVGTVLSLVTLELISLGKVFKMLTYASLAISLFFLAIINFSPVWYVTALFGLIFLVYVISFNKSERASEEVRAEVEGGRVSASRRIPATSLSVLLISLIFILGGGKIGNAVSQKLNINIIDARPSWSATIDVGKNIFSHNPLLGSGPNSFTKEWLLYKPTAINATNFWNSEFDFGIGFIPTLAVTTGILGTLGWLFFLGVFLFMGFRGIFFSTSDKISRYLITSSFLVSLFLWIINIFYVPSLSVVTLSFFFTGLFFSALYQGGVVKEKLISFSDDPRRGFVSVLSLTLLLIGSITIGYAFVEKFTASTNFQKGVFSFNSEGNVDKAEKLILQAASLESEPAYYRTLAQIDILRLNKFISQDAKSIPQDVLRAEFQKISSAAFSHGEQAVSLDPTDYQSWYILGQVYETIVPLKIQNSNAYESARDAYEQALKYNPKSPALLLTRARLEAAHGDNAKAKEYIGLSLQQKNNYTDAIFLLAQIQVAEGNLKDAITSVEAATVLNPNDSGVFFQLGLLRYNVKDFTGAVGAFERAVTVNPAYANAKYFLGLSYQRLGRTSDAIAQFKDLKTTNPDNKEVDLILNNLSVGKNPFTDATPPIDSQPEKRAKPPVSEKTTKSTTSTKTKAVVPDSVGATETGN